jgi:stage II sporulation SpoE-like protein
MREAEATWLVLLSILTLVFAAMSRVFHDAWPLSAYVLPLLLAMNVMSFARLVTLELLTVACMGYTLTQIEITALRLFGLAIVLVAGFIVSVHTHSRTKLGLQAIRGDSMLIDLRDRLATQSQLPTLPHGWYAEAVMKSAGGASFSGDFVVASKTRAGELLELAVVDVSGKGLNAGTRSLQLSGAFGGLLGSLPTQEFLPAANEYLLRQEWAEGFATAIHLAVNLTTGRFELRTAGHPPALQFQAGSGRWTVHWTNGPVLGVVGAAEYVEHSGLLQVGDAILLYTDGLVESPHRDIAFGIDKLLGEAERLVQRGFRGGAERLVAGVNSTSDDRALVLLHRQ